MWSWQLMERPESLAGWKSEQESRRKGPVLAFWWANRRLKNSRSDVLALTSVMGQMDVDGCARSRRRGGWRGAGGQRGKGAIWKERRGRQISKLQASAVLEPWDYRSSEAVGSVCHCDFVLHVLRTSWFLTRAHIQTVSSENTNMTHSWVIQTSLSAPLILPWSSYLGLCSTLTQTQVVCWFHLNPPHTHRYRISFRHQYIDLDCLGFRKWLAQTDRFGCSGCKVTLWDELWTRSVCRCIKWSLYLKRHCS